MTREEAIRILEEERDVYIPKWIKNIKLDFFDRRWVNALELAIKALEQEPRTGHWIDMNVRGSTYPYCSECGNGLDVIYHYPFCPYCGAKMENGGLV